MPNPKPARVRPCRRPPRWHRWRSQLAAGEITPARIAAQLGLTTDEALAWLYPSNQHVQERVRRNEDAS